MPNANVRKIRIIQTGATYLITIVKSFFALKRFPFVSASSRSVLGLRIYPTKIHVRRAVIGIIMLLQRESKKLKKWFPKILIWFNEPKDKAESVPKIAEITITVTQETIRFILNLSRKIETTVSISETDEVSAARKTSAKKSVPIT